MNQTHNKAKIKRTQLTGRSEGERKGSKASEEDLVVEEAAPIF